MKRTHGNAAGKERSHTILPVVPSKYTRRPAGPESKLIRDGIDLVLHQRSTFVGTTARTRRPNENDVPYDPRDASSDDRASTLPSTLMSRILQKSTMQDTSEDWNENEYPRPKENFMLDEKV